MTEERKQTLKKVGILLLALLLVIGSVITMFAINSNKDPEPTEPSINIELPDDNKPTEPDITEPTVPDETVPDDTVPTEPTVPDETKPTEPEPTDPEPTEPEKPKKTVVCIPYLTNTTLTYNGKEQEPTVEKHYKHVEITSDSELTGKNVDTYTVTFKLKDKETMTWTDGTTRDIVCDWKIVQKEVELEWGRLTWPYDGKTHSTTCEITNLCGNDVCTVVLEGNAIKNVGKKDVIAVSLSNKNYKLPADVTRTLVITDSSLGNITSKDATYTYDGKQHSIEDVSCSVSGVKILYSIDDKVYTNVKPSFTEAGTYKIYWSISKEGYKTANGYNTLTIQAKEVELSWGQLKWVYDEKAHSTTCIASNLIGNDVCNITLEGNSITNVGTQPVKAVSVSNKNYKLPEKVEQILEIKAAKLGAVISDDVSFVYDGDNHTINDIQCETENVVIKYSTSNNGNYTTIKPEYKNAGSYTIYWVIEKTGYETKSGSNKLVIEQKEAELKWGQLEWQYDGDEHSTTCSVSNLVEGDACEVVLNGNSIKNVGTQPVKAVELSNKNYKLPTDCERVLKITLNKLGNVISDDAEYTYDGKEHSIEDVQCTTPNTTILYSNSENGNYTAEKPHYVDAGVYKIYWSISKTGYETVMGVNTLTINKAAIAYAKPVNHTYDKTPHFGLDCNGVTFSDNATATNAGKYTVSVKPTKNYLWVDGTDEIKEVTYEIFPIELIVNWGQHEWVYDGQEHATECVISGVLDDDICEVILENNKIGPDVGSEIVKITEITNSNYIVPEEELEYTLKITPAYLPLSTVGGIVTYNGMSRSDRVDVGINIPCNITWAVDTSADFDYNNKTFIAEKPEMINVGRYNVHCKLEPLSDNYRTAYATIEFEILPKEVRLEWGQLSWQYDSKEHSTTCAVTNLCGNDVCDIILENNIVGPKVGTAIVKAVGLTNSNYKLPNDVERTLEIVGLKDFDKILSSDAEYKYDGLAHSIDDVKCSTEGVTITYSTEENGEYGQKPEYINVGVYKIYWKIEKVGYNTATGVNTLTITKSPIATVIPLNPTYNGEEQFGIEREYTKIVSGNPTGTDAGDYTVVVKPADNYAWEDGTDGEKTVVWTMKKAEVNLNWGRTEWTYDGKTHSTTCQAGGTYNDKCDVVLENNEVGPDVGTEIVKAIGLTNENYKLPENTTTEIKIVPAAFTMMIATGSNEYNGQSHANKILVSPDIDDYTIIWSLEKDGEYTEERPVMIDAGKYTVYFKILPASPNYREYISSIEYTITPRPVELEWGQLKWLYDGNTHSTTCVVSNLIEGDSCEIVLDNNLVGPEIGTQIVKAIRVTNTNYTLSSVAEELLEIVPLERIENVQARDLTVEYDGKAHSIPDILCDTPDVKITYSETADGIYASNPSYVDVGTYTVYWKVEKDGYETERGTAALTIYPKTVDLQWGQLEWEYDGETHSTTCTVRNLIDGDVCEVVLENNLVGPEISQQTVSAIKLTNNNYRLPDNPTETLKIVDKIVVYSNTLQTGKQFNKRLFHGVSRVGKVYFTNQPVPSGVETYDVSDVQDGGVIAWYEYSAKNGYYLYVTAVNGGTIYANEDCSQMFKDCGVNFVDWSNLDTSKTIDMSYMFENSYAFTTLDLSSFDTSNVTTMQGMFKDCEKLTDVNVSSFDTAKVTDMSHMFYDNFNLTALDISNFDTSKVTTTNWMFSSCGKLTELEVNHFNVNNLQYAEWMFDDCDDITELDLSSWTPISLISGDYMFVDCSNLEVIYAQDWTNLAPAYADGMFSGCEKLSTSSFPYFNRYLISWEQANTYNGYFTVKEAFNYVERPRYTLEKGTDFNTHIPSSATSISFTTTWVPENTTFIDVSEAQNGSIVGWLDGTTFIVSARNNGIIVANEDCYRMFYNCRNLKSIFFGTFDTTNTKNMSYMFYNCFNLRDYYGLEKFDTSNVTDMSYMFYECFYATSFDLSNFDTSNVTNMSGMFWNFGAQYFSRNSVTTIDLSHFDTSKVTNMSNMFNECAFETLDLSAWDTSSLTNAYRMFAYCKEMKELNIIGFKLNSSSCKEIIGYCNDLETVYSDYWPAGSLSYGYKDYFGNNAFANGVVCENWQPYTIHDATDEVYRVDYKYGAKVYSEQCGSANFDHIIHGEQVEVLKVYSNGWAKVLHNGEEVYMLSSTLKQETA